jgi:hypothetical protein
MRDEGEIKWWIALWAACEKCREGSDAKTLGREHSLALGLHRRVRVNGGQWRVPSHYVSRVDRQAAVSSSGCDIQLLSFSFSSFADWSSKFLFT